MKDQNDVRMLTNAGGKPLAYHYGNGVTVPDSASKEELAYKAFELRAEVERLSQTYEQAIELERNQLEAKLRALQERDAARADAERLAEALLVVTDAADEMTTWSRRDRWSEEIFQLDQTALVRGVKGARAALAAHDAMGGER